MTEDQLKRFIAIRNTSGFDSNLQFHLDLGEAGLTVDDLGPVTKIDAHHYTWQTPFGILREHYGELVLET